MICLDSSVTVKLVVNEEQCDQARALYRSALFRRGQIVAPPLLPIEVTNVVRQQMRGANGISLADAEVILDDFLGLSITIHNPPGLQQRARPCRSAGIAGDL
ncbi:MAG: type II toxin-antitoxin system VapC family toxin [Hyphomicrobiales bacterium]|nr:type II toxin-antitoxin system VapC family toxin [Hyphomicrobiales bacterium]